MTLFSYLAWHTELCSPPLPSSKNEISLSSPLSPCSILSLKDVAKWEMYWPAAWQCKEQPSDLPNESEDDWWHSAAICEFYWNQQVSHRDNIDEENPFLDRNSPVKDQVLTNGLWPMLHGSPLSAFYLVNHSTFQIKMYLFDNKPWTSMTSPRPWTWIDFCTLSWSTILSIRLPGRNDDKKEKVRSRWKRLFTLWGER